MSRRRKRCLGKVATQRRKTGIIAKAEQDNKAWWAKLRHIDECEAHRVSRRIVDFAMSQGANIVVFEHLSHFKLFAPSTTGNLPSSNDEPLNSNDGVPNSVCRTPSRLSTERWLMVRPHRHPLQSTPSRRCSLQTAAKKATPKSRHPSAVSLSTSHSVPVVYFESLPLLLAGEIEVGCVPLWGTHPTRSGNRLSTPALVNVPSTLP